MINYLKNNVIKILGGICIVSIIPYLFLYYYNVPEPFYFSLLPIICCALILIKKDDHLGNGYFGNEPKNRCVTIFLTFLFVLMLSISQLIAFFINIESSIPIVGETMKYYLSIVYMIWSFAVYIPVLVISSYICIRTVLAFGMKQDKNMHESKTSSNKKLLIVMTLLSLFCMISTYPGAVVGPDVAGLWEQIENPAIMSDLHIIGYVYFVYLCSMVLHSQYTVIIVQTILWIVVNHIIVHYFDDIDRTGHMGKIYLLMTIFVFTPYAYLQLMLKDIVFSVLFLGLTLYIIKLVNIGLTNKELIIVCLFGVGIVNFKHGQVITFLLSFGLILIWAIKVKNPDCVKKSCIIMLSSLIAFGAIRGAAFNIQHIEANPKYVTYTVPVSMIGAAVANGVEFTEDEVSTLEMVMPLDRWAECYDKYFLDEISRSWGRIGDDVYTLQEKIENEGYGKEIIKLNAKLVLTHPIIYATAFFDASSIVWEIGMPIDSYTQGIQTYAEDPESTKYFLLWPITDKLIHMGREIPIINDICTRGGIHLFIIIVSAFILVLKKRYKDLLAAFPILLFNALYFLSIPAQQTRYVLTTMVCAIFLFAYSMYVTKTAIEGE